MGATAIADPTTQAPPPPPGFTLDDSAPETSAPMGAPPPPPPGFTIDAPQPTAQQPSPDDWLENRMRQGVSSKEELGQVLQEWRSRGGITNDEREAQQAQQPAQWPHDKNGIELPTTGAAAYLRQAIDLPSTPPSEAGPLAAMRQQQRDTLAQMVAENGLNRTAQDPRVAKIAFDLLNAPAADNARLTAMQQARANGRNAFQTATDLFGQGIYDTLRPVIDAPANVAAINGSTFGRNFLDTEDLMSRQAMLEGANHPLVGGAAYFGGQALSQLAGPAKAVFGAGSLASEPAVSAFLGEPEISAIQAARAGEPAMDVLLKRLPKDALRGGANNVLQQAGLAMLSGKPYTPKDAARDFGLGAVMHVVGGAAEKAQPETNSPAPEAVQAPGGTASPPEGQTTPSGPADRASEAGNAGGEPTGRVEQALPPTGPAELVAQADNRGPVQQVLPPTGPAELTAEPESLGAHVSQIISPEEAAQAKARVAETGVIDSRKEGADAQDVHVDQGQPAAAGNEHPGGQVARGADLQRVPEAPPETPGADEQARQITPKVEDTPEVRSWAQQQAEAHGAKFDGIQEGAEETDPKMLQFTIPDAGRVNPKTGKPQGTTILVNEGEDVGQRIAEKRAQFAQAAANPAGNAFEAGTKAGGVRYERPAAKAEEPELVGPGTGDVGEHFGPGAGSASDPAFAKETSFSALTDRIAQQQTGKPSILSRMMAGESIAKRLSAGKEAIAGALAKLRGGGAAMYDAWKRPPENSSYDKLTREWSGADQKSALEINRFADTIKKAVPEKADRGAMALWIEAGGDQAKLADWAKRVAADPNGKKYADLFDRATRLTDVQKNMARDTMLHNEATLDEAQKAGVLSEGLDNYIMHVWADDPKMTRRLAAESNFNSLITRPGFTRARTIPTYFDGIMKGMTPKDLDFASLTAAHERSFREAVAARAYLRGLSDSKADDGRPLVAVSPASARELPATGGKPDSAYLIKPNLKASDPYADYRTIDHPALRGWKWAAEIDGKPVLMQGDLLVHPDIAGKVRNNLGRSAFQNSALGRAALRVNQEIKGAILSFSAFHQTTLGIHALEHRTLPAGMPELDIRDPKQAALVDHGLMVAHYDGYQQFEEGVASNGLITKIPVIGPAYHAYTDFLFKDYLPRVKMAMALNALERNTGKYGSTLSKDQILSMTADQANAAFGGLNYRTLGRNKTLQDVMRLTLMAPDFLEARTRFTAQAFKPQGGEQRAALVIGALGMYTAARALNAILNPDHDPHWDKPFAVVRDGKEYSLRSIQGDIASLVSDPQGFARNRLSPLVSLGVSLLSGVNRFGHKESAGGIVKDALESNVPMAARPLTQGNSSDSTAATVARTLMSLVGIQSKKESGAGFVKRPHKPAGSSHFR